MANMVNTLLVCLSTVTSMHVVTGDIFSVNENNCTVGEPLPFHRTLQFIDGVPGLDLTEHTECEEHVTMGQSNRTGRAESQSLSPNNVSRGRNETSQQPSQTSPAWYITFKRVELVTRGVCLPIATFLGCIGNILFITILSKGYVQSNSYVYLLCLASSNLCSTVLGSHYFMRAHDSLREMRTFQTFFAFYMAYGLPFNIINSTFGTWVVLLFAIDRFFAVRFPMKALRYSTVRRSKIVLLSAFCTSIALNFVRFFRRTVTPEVDPLTGEHYYSYTLTEFGRNKIYDAITFWSYLSLSNIIPFLLLLIFNSLIIQRIWRARFTRVEMSGKQNQEENEGATREHQITRLLVAIVVAFLMCNLLSCIASMYSAINTYIAAEGSLNAFVYYIFSLALTISNTTPLVNCILYVVCNDAMWNGVKSLIAGRKPEKGGTTKQTKGKTRSSAEH